MDGGFFLFYVLDSFGNTFVYQCANCGSAILVKSDETICCPNCKSTSINFHMRLNYKSFLDMARCNGQKYVLCKTTTCPEDIDPEKVFRIVACMDFSPPNILNVMEEYGCGESDENYDGYDDMGRVSLVDVEVGEEGGFVSGEHNLLQTDYSWIFENAAVLDNALIEKFAYLHDNARVCGNARIVGPIGLQNNTIVRENVLLTGGIVDANICDEYRYKDSGGYYDEDENRYVASLSEGILSGNSYYHIDELNCLRKQKIQ